MISSDHFIYTSAKTDKQTGYQVIAKSNGITETILNSLTEYMYPLGANLKELKKSKSLLILKNKIAFSVVEIGIGFDGRGGTVYNHTFVIDEKDFKKLYYDSRILEEYFIKDDSLRDELKNIEIENFAFPLNFRFIQKNDPELIKSSLSTIFKKKKLALVEIDDANFIQNLLSVLPPSMRLISFSTHVSQPERQSNYDIIQIPRQVQSQLSSNYKQIHQSDPEISGRTDLDLAINYLHSLCSKNDLENIQNLHNEFEKIRSTDYKNKIIMLAYYHLFLQAEKHDQKFSYAKKCYKTLQKLDAEGMEKYLNKLADYLEKEEIKKVTEIPQIFNLPPIFSWFFTLPFWWAKKSEK